jgi:hypothetical protein
MCQDVYKLLEVNHILDTLNRVKHYLSDVLLSNNYVESDTIASLIEHISERYFYPTSEIKTFLEDLLMTKGLQVILTILIL